MRASLLLLALIAQGSAPAPAVPVFPPGAGTQQTVNMGQWDSNSLPPVYERSEQLPLTDEEVTRLSQAGFAPDQLVKMIEERRCACDASAEGLIRMKVAGVDPAVIAAVSMHALKPNRALNLEVTLDFSGESRRARNAYLYLFVDDGELTRVLSANIDELLRRPNAHETTVDNSDFLIARTVRRIVLPGQLPLKSHGRHTVLVASSASPNLTHPSQLKAQDRAAAQTYLLDYPRASLQSLCRLTAGYRRDAQIADRWRFLGSRFECEWN
ncbi:MAG TPA: hypothetical protein VMT11_15295 [Myxococcaceae bacterium]|nr:hypothetical protein [Myxococcaceae bacterium]